MENLLKHIDDLTDNVFMYDSRNSKEIIKATQSSEELLALIHKPFEIIVERLDKYLLNDEIREKCKLEIHKVGQSIHTTVARLHESSKLGFDNSYGGTIKTLQCDFSASIDNFFSKEITTLNEQINQKSEEDLVTNVGTTSDEGKRLASEINNVLPQSYRECFGFSNNILIGGQIKLHPPGCSGSGIWHLDGDPLVTKCLIYLEKTPGDEGNFEYLPNSDKFMEKYTGLEKLLFLREGSKMQWMSMTNYMNEALK